MISGGTMSWADARSGPLAGATCLWQDLDGLRVTMAPEQSPYTSILWAWGPGDHLHRVRLDGDTAHLATVRLADVAGYARQTLPWERDDQRIAAYRGPRASAPVPDGEAVEAGLGSAYAEVTVHPDDPESGYGPITFVYPVRWQNAT